ncbi:MAG: alpha-L-arabinofuranosidase C-terminal domain-containing protein [Lachnospiraceae bacterium]
MKVTINIEKQTKELGSLFGIFFEDINHAADGGLYAEMVQNRSFEFDPIDNKKYHALTAWEKLGRAELSIETADPLSRKNPHYLVMHVSEPSGDDGVRNMGFNEGMVFEDGEKYYASCYARSVQNAEIKLSIRNEAGRILDEASFFIGTEWTKYEALLTASSSTTQGSVAVTLTGAGCVEVDFVSLFPKDTYKGRRNGLRRDLAEALEAMHPKFMRFPGGCLIHDGNLDPDSRDAQYRWKNSVGPIEERPARRNNWDYNQTLGLGYFEYFQFCEDIGAKPLPVLPGGYDPHHYNAASGELLQGFIDDALDLIEFANGDVNTKWGGLRASMGHPEPFGMEYIGIGNEEIGDAFFERSPLFHKAIKDKYPDMKVIGTSGPFAAGIEYEKGWKAARREKADLVDEHYYQSPDWFLAHHHRYDNFDVNGPKVFLGEYASQGNTWYNALAEASFMIALQNAPAVELACYAPLLCNVDYVNWRPDMIWFDNHRFYLTPNYHVQKLYMEHQGDAVLEQRVEQQEENYVASRRVDSLPGIVALGCDDSVVEYSEIVVINEDSKKMHCFADQTVGLKKSREIELETIPFKNYTICLKAKEIHGKKGMRIIFARQDKKNQLCWTLGGWANSDSMISEDLSGRNSCLSQRERKIEQGRTYELEIHVRGRHVETYVDGALELALDVKPTIIEPVYISTTLDRESKDVIVKLVNVTPMEQKIDICFTQELSGWEGTAYYIEGHKPGSYNSFSHPNAVIPYIQKFETTEKDFSWTLPKESLYILRLKQK